MKVRRFSVAAMCLVLSVCALVYSAEYDQNGRLSLLKGDLNRDGYISLIDIDIFCSAWLEQDCDLSNHCSGVDIYPECGDGTINFKDYDGLAGALGQCVDPCDPCCIHVALSLYEPPGVGGTFDTEIISMFSGEFYKSVVDMRIPGIGIDFVWARTYRSRTGTNTSMGNNWSHSYDIRLEACSGNIILHGPTGRRDVYYAQPNGTWAARGFFREISQNPDGSFTMVFSDKGKWNFNSFDATVAPGKINSIVDRNGNIVSFEFDYPARLVTIHTSRDDVSHNRDITIAYNVEGLIESVTDYTGREVRYEYYSDGDSGGSAGDLKSVTTPVVTGTVIGNDFPYGKTTVYTYTKGFGDERLNHNLLTITDPNGNTYLRNIYFGTDDPDDRDFDRVKRQIIGEEANDIIDIRYRQCAPRPGNNYAVMIAIVNDRAGNVRHHWFDQHNRLVILRQYTGFAPDPDQYTDLSHNRPIGKLRPDDPDSYETRYQYNEDHLPVLVDYPNGNYTVIVYQGPNAPPRSRGNLREIHHFAGPLAPVSDQNEITHLFFYDTDGGDPCGFNVLTRYVNPRGNEKLYDYDDSGNRTRTTYKIPGPKPDIVVDYEHDAHGRLTASVQPDNDHAYRRRDEYIYYTEPNDPNYGYLKNVIIDKNTLALTTTLEHDRVGNIVRVIDPNGNDTKLIRNQLDQVVRQISRQVSSGLRYETDIYYDDKDNVVQVAIQNIDEQGTRQANSFFDIFYEYGILNNLTRVIREVDPNHSIVTEHEYDDNYRRTLTRFGEATSGKQPNNNVRTIYDELGLVFRRTLAEGDPCQSTTQYDYNLNGGLKRAIRGLEGVPRITTHNRDGFGRVKETHDAMGNVSKFSYDAAGNLVSVSRYGELLDVEGSVGNVRLFESKYRYDDLNRLFDTEILFFDPNTQAPIGDGNSVTQFFYSDNGLLTKIIDDNGHARVWQYDSAGRLSTTIDAKDNRRIYRYDKNSRVIRLTEIDKVDVTDTNETFIRNFERDGLGRLIKRIDSVGNITKYGYDSRGRCTLITDALNNQSRYEYDGAGRLIKTIRDMDGDGADANDPCDIVIQAAYDDSGRPICSTDDNGNTTGYRYDALGRMTDILFADGTENTFSYNVHGNPVQSVDGDGDLDAFIYDKLNRLTNKSITPGPETADTTTFEEYKFDGGSRLVYAGNDNSIVRFRHDSLGNVVEETLNGQVIQRTFDSMGNPLSLTYPGGRTINYIPDELNRTRIVVDGASTIASYRYVGRRIARADYGNGTRAIYQYDGMKEVPNPPADSGVKRIIKTTHVRVADGNTIDERIYAWDPVGNRKMQKDIRPGGPQLTHDYLYDRVYRLIQTTVTDGTATVVRRTGYGLDGVGNRKDVTGSPDTGPWVGTYFMDPALPEPGDFQMNQYTETGSDSRQYSKNGNLTIIDNDDPGITEIKYDYRNRMVEFKHEDSKHTYSYGPLGRRIGKVVDADGIAGGPIETRYYFAGGRVIEERDGLGTIQATYIREGGPEEDYYELYDSPGDDDDWLYDSPGDDTIITTRGGQDYYYHCDDAGSVMAITDDAGNAVERYRYHEYGSAKIFNVAGQPITDSAIGNSYLFKGKEFDRETGWYYSGGAASLDGSSKEPAYLDPVAGRPITRTGGGINHLDGYFDVELDFTAFGNNPGRDQALSIIGILINLNRPSSAGFHVGGGGGSGFQNSGDDLALSADHPDLGYVVAARTLFGFTGQSLDSEVEVIEIGGFVHGLETDNGGLSNDDEEPTFGFHVGGGGGSGFMVDEPYVRAIAVGGGGSSLAAAGDVLHALQIYHLNDGDSDRDADTDGNDELLVPKYDFLLWLNGGQSLDGSRGDDVWLYGAGFTGEVLGGILRPKPDYFTGDVMDGL